MATEWALRAPLEVPRCVGHCSYSEQEHPTCNRFALGADTIIRTDKPQTLRCGTLAADHPGRNCSSGCKTRAHRSYSECLRDKNTTTYLAAPSRGLDGTSQKSWDRELDRYQAARKQGIQPDGTKMAKIVEAERLSNEKGAAYGRDFSKATPVEMY